MLKILIYKNQQNRNRQDGGTFFQGRNGLGIQTGVEIMASGPSSNLKDRVVLTPISTRGAANCYIEIPLSDIDGFIEFLLEIKKTSKKGAGHEQSHLVCKT